MDEQTLEFLQSELNSLSARLESRLDNRMGQIVSNLTGVSSAVSSLRSEVSAISARASRTTGGSSGRRVSQGPVQQIHTGTGPLTQGSFTPETQQTLRELSRGQGNILSENQRLHNEVSTSAANIRRLLSMLQSRQTSEVQGPGPQRGGLLDAYGTPLPPSTNISPPRAPSILNPGEFTQRIRDISSSPGSPGVHVEEIRGLSQSVRSAISHIGYLRRTEHPSSQEFIRQMGSVRSQLQGVDVPSEDRERQESLIRRRDVGGESLEQEDIEFLAKIDAMDELVQALRNLGVTVTDSGEKQGKSISAMAASVLGAFAVQQFIMLRGVQQPYQYGTIPALGAMGQTGSMGEILSGAYGAQESVLQSYRGMAVSGAAALGGLAGYGVGGAFGGVLGGALGAGLGVVLKDPLADIMSSISGDMDREAFDIELGRRILDPQRYTQDVFMPTLQARMGLGLGLDGANAMEELASFAGPNAEALGYDAVVTGQLINTYLSTLSPALAPTDLEDDYTRSLVDTTARLESYGVSRELTSSILSDLSRAGSQDAQDSLARILYATSADGEVTNYTANVLVPALSRVVESRAIQNIAKSSEQVERETAGLFAYFKSSEGNLGTMLMANPEVMSNIFGMLEQVGESAIQDPALMLYLNRMGLSYADVVTGDPRALTLPLEHFAQYADYTQDGSMNLDSAASVSSILGFLTVSGIGVSTRSFNLASEMMSAINQGRPGDVSRMIEELGEEDPNRGISRLLNRLESGFFGPEGPAEVMRQMVEQSNTFYQLMEEHVGEMGTLQGMISSVLSNTESIANSIQQASLSILGNVVEITGYQREGMKQYLELAAGQPLPGLESRDDATLKAYFASMHNPTLFQELLGAASSVLPELLTFATPMTPGRLRESYSASSPDEDVADVNGANATSTTTPPLRAGAPDSRATGANAAPASLPLSTPADQGVTLNFGEFGEVSIRIQREEQSAAQNFTNNILGAVLSHVFEIKDDDDAVEYIKGVALVYGQDAIPQQLLSDRFGKPGTSLRDSVGWATGGFTGAGGRLDAVGVVHGGEYVISDDRVAQNRNTLERIQSGENLDEDSPFAVETTSSADTIRVMLEFSNTSPEEIINAARFSARQLLIEERLI